jgi:hypothetical protein
MIVRGKDDKEVTEWDLVSERVLQDHGGFFFLTA